MSFDIIGDVHGHADSLKALLRSLDYDERNGAWRHGEGRRVIVVGDPIDRGPAQLETVSIARRMIEADTARIVMGNHEFNAVAFATLDPGNPGQHFRQRKGNNVLHHSVFLNAVGGADTPLHRELIDFFRAMPLWLDLPELRVVHAGARRRWPHFRAMSTMRDGSRTQDSWWPSARERRPMRPAKPFSRDRKWPSRRVSGIGMPR